MAFDVAARRSQIRALKNHGVICRGEAIADGLSERAIDRKLESGEWIRLLSGVYALRGSPVTFMRRVVAGYKWAGEGALISHTTSARLLGLDGIDSSDIEVSTPRRLRSGRVIVHQRKTCELPSQRIDVVRVTSAEQTLIDIATTLPPDKLELAFDSAMRQGRTRYDHIKRHFESIAGPGVPGTSALRNLLQTREPCPRPHHSVLEVGFRQLVRDFGLPNATGQFPVKIRRGLTLHLDFAYPDEKLAIEIDSVRWHAGVRSIKWDNERQNLLVALGWRVLRFEWNDVVHRPHVVAAQIRSALARRQLFL
ncbi:MAG: DUF559 domain-containing protein [Actinomycetota bacterium]